MKKVLLILLILFVITGCSSKKKTEFEEETHVTVGVNSDEYGAALVSLWNNTYPEAEGVLETVTVQKGSAKDFLIRQGIDVYYIPESEAALVLDSLHPLEEEVKEEVFKTVNENYSAVLNYKESYFVPMSRNGYLFAYNENLANNLGISLMDENQDGLPDAFSSFEEIFNEGKKWDVFGIYPLCFMEKYSFYPLLTAGGWQLFAENQAADPGFNRPEFLETLSFIQKCGQFNWYKETELTAEEHPYAFDKALISNTTLFTLIGEDMYFEDAEKAGVHYVYAHMPSWNGNILTPLCKTEGYVIRKTAEFPEACEKVLELIRSHEGMQLFMDNTETIPLLNFSEEWGMDVTLKEKALAIQYSQEEPYIGIETDPTIKAWNIYYEIDWMSPVVDVFNQGIQPEVAQEQIHNTAKDWLMKHGTEIYVYEVVEDGE